MQDVLDNPIWNALNSGNSSLSIGNEFAKYFPAEISTFVGLAAPAKTNFSELFAMLPAPGVGATTFPQNFDVPPNWTVLKHDMVLQMIYDGRGLEIQPGQDVVALDTMHVPGMIKLNRLTKPGPFNSRTIEFGNYQGIFEAGNLVAMAGRRLHPYPYQEISGVCTHPEHLRNGYASTLIRLQVNAILQESGVPILHVKADNETAINLYRKLGFRSRQQFHLKAFQKIPA